MEVLPGAGSLLGFHDTPEFDVKRYRMPPGDRIFIYTDGILENGRTAGKSISFSKLRRTLSQRDKPVFETQDAILSLFKTTWRNAPIEDDYSMILLEWVTRA